MNDVAVKNNGPVAEKTQRRVVYTPQVDVLENPRGDGPATRHARREGGRHRGPLRARRAVGPRQAAGDARQGRGLVEEFEPGDYYRAFLISQDVAADRITAELKHGVLTVHLPQHEAAKPRKVEVKVG